MPKWDVCLLQVCKEFVADFNNKIIYDYSKQMYVLHALSLGLLNPPDFLNRLTVRKKTG